MIDVKCHPFHSTPESRSLCKLTPENLKFLEKTSDFTPGDKIELLEVLTHRKWVGELDIRRERVEHNQLHVEGLGKLGLSWRTNSYIKQNGVHVYWIQVGANSAILDYLDKYHGEIDSLEAGILYGYPLTAVLGFVNIIDVDNKAQGASMPGKSAAEFYLAGVLSREFVKQERDYFEQAWESLSKFAPKVTAEAESYYRYWRRKWAARDKDKPFSDKECYEKWRAISH